MSEISHFQELLRTAEAQAEPQRLLFVFAVAELPDDATPLQKAGFLSGGGGTLTPLMCVDKAPADLADFQNLVEESRRAGPPWQVVFAASLSGGAGAPPNDAQIEAALQSMVDAVQAGAADRFLVFGPTGDPIIFH